ncbi:MAG: HTH-type transcriptional repressor AseR [Syntrophaceae bacterium PtaB.Bin038]|nr:MAG: HTH-type transcriptional repressor AseR [Syntrophaceae bacterium PtaB.Bin038]
MKDFIRVMKALSDPNRVKMVKMLQQKEMCVCEMQEALGITQPTVSKHLKILEDAGLVQSKKDGLWVNYRLIGNDANPYAVEMLGMMEKWLGDDVEIRRILRRLPDIRREEVRKKPVVTGGKPRSKV